MSNVKKSLFGSILLVAQGVLRKLVGMVSTLILARVLVPEDFGLVAIATLIIGFVEIFAVTGSGQYLLRSDNINNDMVNTSWTIGIIIKGIAALALVIAGPFAAEYYGDNRLIPIIYVLAGKLLFATLTNPGIILMHREQIYLPTVKLNFLSKIIAVMGAVSVALIYKSYWALIVGQWVYTIIYVFGSYIIQPHRPRLCLANARKQWQFSGWVMPQSVLGYVRTQIDVFIVSSTFGKADLGYYHVMKYFALIPGSEIITPATQPLLVELAKIKHNKNYFAFQNNVAFVATMLIALPITGMMYFHSTEIVAVILGSQWVKHAEIFSVFSLLVLAFSFLGHARRVLMVYGNTKAMFFYELGSSIVLYGTLLLVGISSVIKFAYLRAILDVSLCILFLTIVTAKATSISNTIKMYLAGLPILLSCLAGAWVSSAISLDIENVLLRLIVVGSTFSLSFALILYLTYLTVLRNNKEWQYIGEIVTRGKGYVLSKISR